jgi:serine/threonine protein kinase
LPGEEITTDTFASESGQCMTPLLASSEAFGVPAYIERDEESPSRYEPLPLARGDRIGRYTIRSLLAEGGMGMVFRAVDRQLGRRVAIKLLRPRTVDGTALFGHRDRLLREAQALAQLSHPNIVTIYDVGTTKGSLFIAMEYVDGRSLRAWLAQRRRPWHEIAAVFVQAGRGLAAAHAAGIVHRDFKPGNVLIGRDGRVRVLDFGIARGLDDDQAARSDQSLTESDITRPEMLSARLTDVNIVLGTAGYIAPEQLFQKPVTPRSDQFSFCVALYEALFGVRPYPGKDGLEVARAFRKGCIAAPEKKQRIPRRMRRALVRGLAVDPDLRHPSMDTLLCELEACPAERPRPVASAVLLLSTACLAAYGALWFHEHVFPGPAHGARQCEQTVPEPGDPASQRAG